MLGKNESDFIGTLTRLDGLAVGAVGTLQHSFRREYKKTVRCTAARVWYTKAGLEKTAGQLGCRETGPMGRRTCHIFAMSFDAICSSFGSAMSLWLTILPVMRVVSERYVAPLSW